MPRSEVNVTAESNELHFSFLFSVNEWGTPASQCGSNGGIPYYAYQQVFAASGSVEMAGRDGRGDGGNVEIYDMDRRQMNGRVEGETMTRSAM